MSTLEHAIAIAARAHAGQIDKLGQPYILHPLRVMLAVSPRARIAAVLHDVIEDTGRTADDLYREGFIGPDLAAVVLLTKLRHESYEAYIARCAGSEIAREVKIADIGDNYSSARFDHLPAAEQARRGPKYRKALEQLRGPMSPLPNLQRAIAGGAS